MAAAVSPGCLRGDKLISLTEGIESIYPQAALLTGIPNCMAMRSATRSQGGLLTDYAHSTSSISALASVSLSIKRQSGKTSLTFVFQFNLAPFGKRVPLSIRIPTLSAANTFEHDAIRCLDYIASDSAIDSLINK